jgi:hypothetical protein
LKILQSKTPIPDNFLKKEIYKYPFEILDNLSNEEKQETLNQIKKEYNKYFSEEFEIAKQYWKSMNIISSFLCDENKKNLLNNEEITTLLDNYKSEEEMLQIELEIKKNMNSDNDDNDTQFWRNAYELLNYLKHKKLMEDLYNNFINNQRINFQLKKEEKNFEEKNNKMEIQNENDRKKILNKDLEIIRYNKFMNEESNDSGNEIDDDEKTEDDLSPQKYESDSEGELNKIAINQMDYFAKLNASRKKILLNKINEYKENKINEEIILKNKKKMNKVKEKNFNNNRNNINCINLDEQDDNDIDIIEDNKQKANKFLDFIINQKQKQKEELIKNKDNSSSDKEEESDGEALNFLQKIKAHKNKNNFSEEINDYSFSKINKKKFTEDIEDKNKDNEQLTEFQKTIQNFDKYLDKNDISGVYTNLEIIENTFRDLDKNSDNELVFNDIVEIKKEYEWAKDYKPIKPRYANKKILGFDWNKHNQAHYDNINLPPKTVSGYRFNIFYPNLVDKTKTPKFYLQRSETPDMCIIRFESGAPYEDVAFKIINREWNTRQKGDFLNVFDKGVLKLYFKFKRFRYKR